MVVETSAEPILEGGWPYIRGITISIFVVLLVMSAPLRAEITASVDRADIELNETFTLKVTVDNGQGGEPDASALNKDFDVLQLNQGSSTMIVNGDISRSFTWSYTLMPKVAGQIEIPPIKIGNEQSNPLYINVAEPSTTLAGESDIFVTADADYLDTYVQAQVLYTIKVYRAVTTRQPRLWEPTFEGVEVLVEAAAEERSYDAVLKGKAYNVVERVYALFPQESGKLTIAPVRFEARVLRAGRITGRKLFVSEGHEINVQPIPAPPPGFPDAAWLPAKAVEIRETWSRDFTALPAGEPVTRRISVSALGQLSTQIPVLAPAVPDGVKMYPDKPELTDKAEAGGVRATRKEQYALIGVTPGEHELPELKLPWWNVDARAWQVATLPARGLTVEGAPPALPVAPSAEYVVESLPPATVTVEGTWWRNVSIGLAAAWAITAFAWWWSRRPASVPAGPDEIPFHRQQARILRRARRAAVDRDAASVKSELLAWGRLEWPDDAPRNIGVLAQRVSEPLATELQKLINASYSAGEYSWDGEALARSLRSFSTTHNAEPDAEDGLPPLLPNS